MNSLTPGKGLVFQRGADCNVDSAGYFIGRTAPNISPGSVCKVALVPQLVRRSVWIACCRGGGVDTQNWVIKGECTFRHAGRTTGVVPFGGFSVPFNGTVTDLGNFTARFVSQGQQPTISLSNGSANNESGEIPCITINVTADEVEMVTRKFDVSGGSIPQFIWLGVGVISHSD